MGKAVTISKEDNALQEKMALDELLSCAGFKMFKEQFDSVVGYSDAQLINDKNKYVTSDALSKFNYDLGYAAGLKAVHNILKGFEDDLARSSASNKK